jgi:hypothetical protein
VRLEAVGVSKTKDWPVCFPQASGLRSQACSCRCHLVLRTMRASCEVHCRDLAYRQPSAASWVLLDWVGNFSTAS